jgi:hypothetical protein
MAFLLAIGSVAVAACERPLDLPHLYGYDSKIHVFMFVFSFYTMSFFVTVADWESPPGRPFGGWCPPTWRWYLLWICERQFNSDKVSWWNVWVTPQLPSFVPLYDSNINMYSFLCTLELEVQMSWKTKCKYYECCFSDVNVRNPILAKPHVWES